MDAFISVLNMAACDRNAFTFIHFTVLLKLENSEYCKQEQDVLFEPHCTEFWSVLLTIRKA